MILIDLENPNRDTIEQMFRVSREVKRPIAMFVDESDPETTKSAIRAGVSAYIIDGLRRAGVGVGLGQAGHFDQAQGVEALHRDLLQEEERQGLFAACLLAVHTRSHSAIIYSVNKVSSSKS